MELEFLNWISVKSLVPWPDSIEENSWSIDLFQPIRAFTV